jgi:hypothetical protein
MEKSNTGAHMKNAARKSKEIARLGVDDRLR